MKQTQASGNTESRQSEAAAFRTPGSGVCTGMSVRISIKIVYFLDFIQYKRQKENSVKEVSKLTIRLVCRAGKALVK